MDIINVTTSWSNWGLLGFFIMAFGLIICIAIVENWHVIGGLVSGIVCMCIGLAIIILSATVWKVTAYEVYIKDNSSYEYLMENYEFIEQRGKVWIVRDKK